MCLHCSALTSDFTTSNLHLHRSFSTKVLDTFLALKIKEIAAPGEGGKKKKFLREKSSRRERKRKTNLFNLEKELENADAATNKRKRLRFVSVIPVPCLKFAMLKLVY